eukprot:11076418-Lingulodinium_polyedra.AAC.1
MVVRVARRGVTRNAIVAYLAWKGVTCHRGVRGMVLHGVPLLRSRRVVARRAIVAHAAWHGMAWRAI